MIDQIDAEILSFLQNDAKATYADIGKKVNLTAPTVFERIKRLEKMEVIKGYGVILNDDLVREKISAFVRISTIATIDSTAYSEFLKEIREITDCYDVAGEENFFVRIDADGPQELNNILKRIRQIPGTTRASTVLVLSKVFERNYDMTKLINKPKA